MSLLRQRAVAPLLAPLLLAAAAAAQQEPSAPPPPTMPPVEEELVVREVGVFADLPERLRGKGAEVLRDEIVVLEGGIAREAVSVTALDRERDAYGRVLIVVDRARCDEAIVRAAGAALGAAAETLAALGPVAVAELEDELSIAEEPTREPEELAKRLARFARATCPGGAKPPVESVDLPAAALECPDRPCLMIWAGPGWGATSADGGPRPVSSSEVEPLARRLAAGGWAFLAAPIVPSAADETRRHLPEAENRPGSDRHTFGVDVLDRDRGTRAPVTEAEYERFVDVWRSPLRRLVGATAGEHADRPEELGPVLQRLAGRSILWYRTDRPMTDEAPRIVVTAPGGEGRRFRTAEWAAAAAPSAP